MPRLHITPSLSDDYLSCRAEQVKSIRDTRSFDQMTRPVTANCGLQGDENGDPPPPGRFGPTRVTAPRSATTSAGLLHCKPTLSTFPLDRPVKPTSVWPDGQPRLDASPSEPPSAGGDEMAPSEPSRFNTAQTSWI